MACKSGENTSCVMLSLRLKSEPHHHHFVLTCSISLLLKYPPGALTILCTFAPAEIVIIKINVQLVYIKVRFD